MEQNKASNLITESHLITWNHRFMALYRPLSKQRRKVEEKLERRKNKWNKKKSAEEEYEDGEKTWRKTSRYDQIDYG